MDSEVISGFALHGQAVGTIRHVKSAKVAVFAGLSSSWILSLKPLTYS
jgi:hypothetical protein